MNILGISTPGPNVAAALVNGNGIIAAIEEEKLSRVNSQDAAPHLALLNVLKASGMRLDQTDHIAVADFHGSASHKRLKNAAHEASRAELRRLLTGRRFSVHQHHHCHAASAYYCCDFSRALILSLDYGERGTAGMVALGEADAIKPLHYLTFPNSLGWFYSRCTELAGLRPQRDEHKLQWLSRNGQADYREVLQRVFAWNSKGLPVLDRKYFSPGPDKLGHFSPRLCRDLGLSRSAPSADRRIVAAIARSAQEVLDSVVLQLAANFREPLNVDSLCLAGGIFQNLMLVRALEQHGNFKNVFVQPVAGNAGTALGAAFLARKRVTGHSGRVPLASLALGPEPSSQEIKAVLDNCKIAYRYFNSEDQLLEETSEHLQRGKIVGWCQGRTEFGHRALGNRSLLASPFNEYVLDNVNQFIKHREDFHPFALSVPTERAQEFFDCSASCRFMASLGDLKNPIAGLERFTFNGNAVRVHTVDRETSPLFWRLLHKFGETAPAPILVNTSFNLFGEPLVTDPRSAVRSFYCSGTDVLAVGPFLVVK